MSIPFPERIACTVQDAVQASGIQRAKLYEEMAAGRIQSTTVGNRRLVLVASLLAFLEPRAHATWQQASESMPSETTAPRR